MNLVAVVGSISIPKQQRLNVYLQTARNPAFGKWGFDPFQVEDLRFAIDSTSNEIMFLRCRGGSKTRDASVLAVFFGYQRNRAGDLNRILWYAGADTQLKAVKGYFRENRYVQSVTDESILLWNGNIIQLRLMSEKQAVSPRSDITFFDEEQSMKPEIYQMALGTMIGGAGRRIHLGTTELDTEFERNFNRLSHIGMVREHHIDELSWTTEQEALKLYEGQPQFVIDSQLYCKWVRAGGSVFPNIEVKEINLTPAHMGRKYYGLDPNPKSGHAVVRAHYLYPNILYFAEEFPAMVDSFQCARVLKDRIVHDASIEIEENAGEEFLKILNNVVPAYPEGANVYIERWDEHNKALRIFNMRTYQIVIHPDCKETIRQFKGAKWNPKEPQARLMKTAEQHYLDAGIHASHGGSSSVIQSQVYADELQSY